MITSLTTKWHSEKIIYSIDDFVPNFDTYKRISNIYTYIYEYVYNDFLVEFDAYLKRFITSNVSL